MFDLLHSLSHFSHLVRNPFLPKASNQHIQMLQFGPCQRDTQKGASNYWHLNLGHSWTGFHQQLTQPRSTLRTGLTWCSPKPRGGSASTEGDWGSAAGPPSSRPGSFTPGISVPCTPGDELQHKGEVCAMTTRTKGYFPCLGAATGSPRTTGNMIQASWSI